MPGAGKAFFHTCPELVWRLQLGMVLARLTMPETSVVPLSSSLSNVSVTQRHHTRTQIYLPMNANLSLYPLLPWSKLLCVTTCHFTASDIIVSPSRPSILFKASSSFPGSSFTSNVSTSSFGRVLYGARIADGARCHLGGANARSSFGLPDSEAREVTLRTETPVRV